MPFRCASSRSNELTLRIRASAVIKTSLFNLFSRAVRVRAETGNRPLSTARAYSSKMMDIWQLRGLRLANFCGLLQPDRVAPVAVHAQIAKLTAVPDSCCEIPIPSY